MRRSTITNFLPGVLVRDMAAGYIGVTGNAEPTRTYDPMIMPDPPFHIFQTKKARKGGYFIVGDNSEGVGRRSALSAEKQAERKSKRKAAKKSRNRNRSR